MLEQSAMAQNPKSAGDFEAMASAFWSYSLSLYAVPGVEGACLELQDEAGLNVNLMLFCCWLASEGHALPADRAQDALEVVRPCQDDFVTPLRSARRWLKTADGLPDETRAELGRKVLSLELEGERLLQLALVRGVGRTLAASPIGQATASLAMENLGAYLAVAGCDLEIGSSAAADSRLQTLVRAAFPA
ncbi:MAG: TIGR02444 family protein [Pseudomonadota bacterium]